MEVWTDTRGDGSACVARIAAVMEMSLPRNDTEWLCGSSGMMDSESCGTPWGGAEDAGSSSQTGMVGWRRV